MHYTALSFSKILTFVSLVGIAQIFALIQKVTLMPKNKTCFVQNIEVRAHKSQVHLSFISPSHSRSRHFNVSPHSMIQDLVNVTATLQCALHHFRQVVEVKTLGHLHQGHLSRMMENETRVLSLILDFML
jgi:hypothetical protein